MIFLGMLSNTVTMSLEVTPEKAEIRALICQWIGMSSASLKQIQSLLGKLNFIPSCVRPAEYSFPGCLIGLGIFTAPQLQPIIYP